MTSTWSKEFFDTYLFLPQVKLQKNNPLKQQITGVQNDYEITYTYDFQNNLPVKKTGIMTQTRGSRQRADAANNQPVQLLLNNFHTPFATFLH